jgi:hypothetical protein
MSLMLDALKQIEAKHPRPQPCANKPSAGDRLQPRESAEVLPKAEAVTAIAEEEPCDADLSGLHPVIEEELDKLPPSQLLVQEPVSDSLTVQYAISDSLTIDETLARVESAVASVLQTEAPDIYEDMAQYILTQLTPGQPAALLFTSPRDGTEQTEMLYSLLKTLENKCQGQVYVLDALPRENKAQYEISPNFVNRWDVALAELKKRYQLVLIDAPSLAHVLTAAMISRCDGVYLVIRLGYTTPYDVRESGRVIQQSGGRLLGSIAIG